MNTIPIENLYFLLCYSWNRLDESDIVSVSTTDVKNLLDLFVRVLISGTSFLLRRGLDRGYVSHREIASNIRGHLDLTATCKRNLINVGKAICEYDEMSYDVIHNQILKSTIKELIGHSEISSEHEESLIQIYRRLYDVKEVELSSMWFGRVRLHRNNAFYGFLLSICRLIYENILAKEGSGDYLFQDFIRDPSKMAHLFEDFVRNFYRIELQACCPECKVVGAEKIDWLLDEECTDGKEFIPTMKTDISIEWPGRYLIVDTKYYSQTFQTYYDKKTIHNDNLNQLFAYLMNIESQGEKYLHCEGMLLYPTIDEEVDIDFPTHGHRVMVKTINLNQEWQSISRRLLEIVDSNVSMM